MKLKIRNWDRYQHYKDRSPIWVKLYARDLVSSEDWITWDDASRCLAVASIALASRYHPASTEDRGCFEVNSLEYVQKSCSLNQLPDFKPLIDSRFLVVIDDASNLLAERYQPARQRREEESREEKRREDKDDPPGPPKGGRVKFTPPTIDEVEDYRREKNLPNLYPEQFVDFYESKGWMVGKNKMKDWKAAARNWDRTEKAKKAHMHVGER